MCARNWLINTTQATGEKQNAPDTKVSTEIRRLRLDSTGVDLRGKVSRTRSSGAHNCLIQTHISTIVWVPVQFGSKQRTDRPTESLWVLCFSSSTLQFPCQRFSYRRIEQNITLSKTSFLILCFGDVGALSRLWSDTLTARLIPRDSHHFTEWEHLNSWHLPTDLCKFSLICHTSA